MMTATITLRDYQNDAIHAVTRAWQRGTRRPLITLPTGAGKTVVFGSIARKATDANHRVLVLVHTEELVDQAAKTLSVLLPGVDVGIVRAHHDRHDAQVIVATVQTLRSPKRLAKIGRFGLIVIDEAHHAIAKTYVDILHDLGAFDPASPYPLVLGVTATADRGDGKGLAPVFEDIAYEIGIFELIQRGYLSDIRAKRIVLDIDLDHVDRRHGDFADGALGEAMADAGAPEHIAQSIAEHASDRKTIVFLPTVDMAEQTAAAIRDIGITARSVSGQTPKAERAAIIDDIRAGKLQVVTNCMVLTEGFDAPVLDCAVMARPTSSRALYQQSAGRVLRPAIGKKDALILDMVGVTSRHKLHSAASLIDALPNGEAIGDDETVTEAVDRIELERAESEHRAGRLMAFDVDLFNRSHLNWVSSEDNMFVLTGANHAFAIRCDRGEGCDLFRLDPNGYTYRAVRIADDVTVDMAQGIAEGLARKSGFDATALRNQTWRTNPASDAQRRKLWAMGIRSRTRLASIQTSGEASDLIAQVMAIHAIQAFDSKTQEGNAA